MVIDCIVTNNYSARGAGVAGANSLRCRFSDNRANETGCDVYSGKAYNCFFGDVANGSTYNFYGPASTRCVNCTFAGTGYAGALSAVGCGFYNCLVLKNVAMRMTMTNCVYTGSLGNNSSAGNSKKVDSVEAVHLDASYRPLRNSPALDKGDAAYYTLPDAVADEAVYDFLKAARVQGLGIDIGALESSESLASTNWYVNAETGNDLNDGETTATAFKYDWCGDFAQRLRRSRVAVVQASESVVTNGLDALTIPADSSIEIVWTPLRTGIHTFRAVPAGEGALATLTLDGETLEPTADGVYTFVGEKDTAVTITVASGDNESAVIRDFAGPGRLVFSFR